MHKKTTLRDLKVLLLKTILPVLVLTCSFYVTSAQNVVSPPKKDGTKAKSSVVTSAPRLTKEMVKANKGVIPTIPATATDVPAINKQVAEKMAAAKLVQGANFLNTPPTSNIVTDVCTFQGSLAPGDGTIANRITRDGVGIGTSCLASRGCPGTNGTGPVYYDTYSMQNLTCAAQCVTVTYENTGGDGDVFVTAYNGSFNNANVCTNYLADGGSSVPVGFPPITYNFTVPANATIIFVASGVGNLTPMSGYKITVSGLNCTPPPACTPIGPSVLSLTPGPSVSSTVFNETFNTVVPLPAGWAQQNLSLPVGATNWFQGNTAVFPGNTAPGYIAANFNNTSALATISNWLFAPAVTLKNGDTLSFYTRTTTGTFPDRLQVRMNTTNQGVNVGATNTSVGDYTTLLLDINPTYTTTGYPTGWTQFKIPITGLAGPTPGRIAFRYFVENGGPPGANSDYIGVDDVVYTTTNPGPPPTTCTGSTTCLKVDITGGAPGATYNVTINSNPGGNFTVNNYTSGDCIPVTPPAGSTIYTLVSVIDASNPCCVGTGNSGTVTITPLPATITPISISANPSGPLCAGDPTLLTVIGAPGAGSFTSAGGLTINSSGTATPYPLPLVVSGLPAGATVASVRLNALNHTWTGDIDIALTGPTFTAGGSTQAVMLLSDLGNDANDDAVNTNLTFQDGSPRVPNQNPIPSGTYSCTNDGAVNDVMPAPGPNLNVANPLLTALNAATMNGTWNLWINDQVGGDGGSLASYTINFAWPPAPPPVGWTFLWSPAAGLSSTTTNPVAASPSSTRTYTVVGTAPGGCQTAASILITVYQRPAVTSQPSNVTACATSTVTFTVGGTGQGITYQWQVSTNGGGTYTNIANGAPYSGATTTTLTINPVTVAMSGYRYRCVISGTCSPAANSVGAILTVNALPNVTIAQASPQCGGVPGINGTALVASGANTYVWSPVTGLYTSNTTTPANAYTGQNLATVYAAPTVNTVYTVTGTNTGTGCTNTATVQVVYTPAAPTVSPANVAMCLGDNAVQLCVTSSLAPQAFTSSYSSGPISVPVPDNTPAGGNHTINVPLPSTAQITNMRVTVNMSHTWVGDVAMVLKAPNGQILNLDFFLNATGGSGATTGFTNTTFTSDNTAPAISTGTNPYTGTFRADRVVTGTPAAGPTGFLPTTNTWANLYSTPNGNWTLAAYDAFAGDAGNISSWSLAFDYLYGPPASGVWTPATGLYRDAAATIPYVAGDSANCVYAKPIPSGVYPYQVTVRSVGFPGSLTTYNNATAIPIPDGGTTSSSITVSGLPTSGVTVDQVVLRGFSHTWGGDVNVVLQSPGGQNVILLANSNTDPLISVSNVTLTLRDNAAGSVPTTSPMASGTYKPTNNNGSPFTFLPPGPAGVTGATPNPLLSTITGNPNGIWKIYAEDRVGGDVGTFAQGWSLTLNSPFPGCVSPARTVTVTVNQPTSVVTQPVNRTVCTDKVATFSVVAGGSGPFSYQWQESTNTGNTWSNISNGGVYAGATSATLTITAPPVSMSGYMYRCVITGAAPCASINSFQVLLTVNPLPTVVISASPYTRLYPGLRTTLSSTVSPSAAQTYQWFRNGAAYGGNTSSLNLDVDQLGLYQLTVTDVNNCTNTSNSIDIRDSAVGRCFIYPNPTNGEFDVRYYSVLNNSNLPRTVTVYNASGNRILTQRYSIGAPYQRMHVDLRGSGKGLYWVEVGDANGNRLTMCRVVVQ